MKKHNMKIKLLHRITSRLSQWHGNCICVFHVKQLYTQFKFLIKNACFLIKILKYFHFLGIFFFSKIQSLLLVQVEKKKYKWKYKQNYMWVRSPWLELYKNTKIDQFGWSNFKISPFD